ncbi:MAG: TRAP transporter large permease subunit [Alphaproteobacteria bacterium]|nr:TRAP transporter large permease subunit [Alphaproteobacteria bacterium]
METFIHYLPVFMFLTLALGLFTGLPVAVVIGGVGLSFGGLGIALDVFREAQFALLVNRIYGGIVENLVLVAVPMFVFMGAMLEASGVAKDLLKALQVLLRRVPGGLALSVALLGTILAAATGIIGASVVLLTILALPVMLQRGYSPSLASGTIAASGTLGILIPPSIMLVIMGDLLSISVGTLFIAALAPGLVLAVLYMLYIVTVAGVRPHLAPPLADDEGPSDALGLIVMVVRSFLPVVFLIALVLGSIVGGWATPTEASGVGAAGATLLALLKGRLSWKTMNDVVRKAVLTSAMLFFIFVGATAFSYVFRVLGGEALVIETIQAYDLSAWGILMLVMVTVFLLGFFFDWIEITLIVLPIFAPIVALLDFGTHVPKPELIYWFTILIAVNLQSSFLTPPFGLALFFMKGAAGRAVRTRAIYRGTIPFLVIQLATLALLLAVPNVALWLPRTLGG